MHTLAKSSPFHLFTNPSVINRFTLGHGVVIYYIISYVFYDCLCHDCGSKLVHSPRILLEMYLLSNL